jgi:hypothetical protein
MAEAGDRAGTGAGTGEAELDRASEDITMRALRMRERLVAGRELAEVAADEGLTPRRARQLMAEAVAQRGFDP